MKANHAVAGALFGAMSFLVVPPALAAQPVDPPVREQYPILQIQTNYLYQIYNGNIYDLVEGRYVSITEMQNKLGPLGAGVVVGIILGAGGGAVGAWLNGLEAWQVALGGLFGGIGGFYSALALSTTWTGMVLLGAEGVFVGSGLPGLVGRPTTIYIETPPAPPPPSPPITGCSPGEVCLVQR